MKVTFLAEKYKIGSNRGLYYHEKSDILENLNFVIDFENSTYPEKWVETEDKKAYHKTNMTKEEFFKGTEEKLKPGDMFVYEGQVFAIDRPDRLIVCLSESGPLAVKRFVTEILDEEVKLAKGDPEYQDGELIVKEIESLPSDFPKDDVNPYYIPFYKEKVWRDRVEWPKNFEITFGTNLSFIPVRLFIIGNQVWFYPEEIDPEMVPDLASEFMSRSWKQFNHKGLNEK